MVLGKSGNDLCPVKAPVGYLRKRGLNPGPFFIQKNGHPLTKPAFVSFVKERMERLGYDPGGYSGHSFRAGVATTAAKVGVEDLVIKALGRWESSAYLICVKEVLQSWPIHIVNGKKLKETSAKTFSEKMRGLGLTMPITMLYRAM